MVVGMCWVLHLALPLHLGKSSHRYTEGCINLLNMFKFLEHLLIIAN